MRAEDTPRVGGSCTPRVGYLDRARVGYHHIPRVGYDVSFLRPYNAFIHRAL